jgi:hypothetical protein
MAHSYSSGRITGRQIVEALPAPGSAWRGGGGTGHGMCRCPAHADRTASLSVKDVGERIVLHCFAGCNFKDIARELRALGLWEEWDENGLSVRPRRSRPQESSSGRRARFDALWGHGTSPESHPDATPEDYAGDDPTTDYITAAPEPDEIARQQAAREIWRRAAPIGDDAAKLYLWSRNLDVRRVPPTLRYASQLFYTGEKKIYPALVGAVKNSDNHITAVQRIWVTSTLETVNGVSPKNTKAPLPTPKKTLGLMGDGAVRLAPARRILGIAEGIESGLSAMQYWSLPVWVSCGAWRMDRLWVPDIVEKIIIFGDNGEAGHEAAHKAALAYHARGLQCDIEFPPEEFADWNDVLTGTRRGNQ